MRFKELTNEQKEKIKLDYLSGKSCQNIANNIGGNNASVWFWLKKMNVLIRENHGGYYRKYRLNKNVFNEINSDSAYWIGFLMADGNVSVKSRTGCGHEISIVQNEKDLAHLYKFKDFLGYSGNIRKEKSDERHPISILYRINVSSVDLIEKLISYGVTPRKSLTAKVIGLEDNRDFWRGVVDGDGSICIETKRNRQIVSLCGSQNLMEQFSMYARKVVPMWKGKSHSEGSIYYVQVSGNNSLVLMKNLYKDAITYLDRKYELAKRLTGDFHD